MCINFLILLYSLVFWIGCHMKYNLHHNKRVKISGVDLILRMSFRNRGDRIRVQPEVFFRYRISKHNSSSCYRNWNIFLAFRFQSIRKQNFKYVFQFRLNRNRIFNFTGFPSGINRNLFFQNLIWLQKCLLWFNMHFNIIVTFWLIFFTFRLHPFEIPVCTRILYIISGSY